MKRALVLAMVAALVQVGCGGGGKKGDGTPPEAPSGLIAQAVSATSIALTWTDQSSDETAFRIERSATSGTADFVEVARVAADTTSWTDTGLLPGATYWYRVRASNAAGKSAYSGVASATTTGAPPGAPLNLYAVADGPTSIELSWTAGGAGQTGFRVERSGTSATAGFAEVATASGAATTFTDTALSPATQYWYRVRATNAFGDSPYSNVDTATTSEPARPAGLFAVTQGPTSIQLSWTAGAADQTGFRVERSATSAVDGFAEITAVSGTVTTYLDAGLAAGTQYWYRVRAVYPYGLSAYSDPAAATTLGPARPVGLSALAQGPTSIELSWVPGAADATSYEIERSATSGTDGFAFLTAVTGGAVSYLDAGLLPATPYWYRIRAVYAYGTSGYSDAVSAVTERGAALPPDPAAVAPPLDRTVATSFADAVSFLWAGPTPIQTGVVPGSLDEERVAVLRGKVRDASGSPLPGVTIAQLDHPELGSTLTRADGVFDLAVNGGGPVMVEYRLAGYLPAQRQVVAPWKDFAWAPDVVLLPLDPRVSVVQTGAAAAQVARGSPSTDASGTRTATVIVPPGTFAGMTLPDGSSEALPALHVRATEYTVGPDGPAAMPAGLPPTTGYTYAVEVSVDEAISAGATGVQFSQPVYVYLENFLGFPVGSRVPSGSYDLGRGVWVPSPSGRVVQVVSTSGGSAGIDADGDGAADDPAALAALGFTDAERTQVAALYQAGQTLWRTPITHLSPWDFNWPVTCDDCPPVEVPPPPPGCPDPEICGASGSFVDCQNQALEEDLPVVGTPFSLHYRSDRVAGNASGRTVRVTVTDARGLTDGYGTVWISVAGQSHGFGPFTAPNQTVVFTWDGKDAYGRLAQGSATAVVMVNYHYTGEYCAVWQDTGFGTATCIWRGLPVGSLRWSADQSSTWRVEVSSLQAPFQSLGGWSLDVHHAYDPKSGTLYRGDGPTFAAQLMGGGGRVIQVAAGGGNMPPVAGGLARDTLAQSPVRLAVTPDGRYYVVLEDGSGFRVSRAGSIEGVAGGPGSMSACTGASIGDGGFVDDACFLAVDVAVAPDGKYLIADAQNARIRKVDRQAFISTFAGGGSSLADGVPALEADLDGLTSVAVGPDGSVYVLGGNRLRKIDPAGMVYTIAGDGTCPDAFTGEGGFARDARFCASNYSKVAVGGDGSVYLATEQASAVYRIRTDGRVERFAGTGVPGDTGDGGPATAAQLQDPSDVAVALDGTVYVADGAACKVRAVGPDGSIRTAAGTGAMSGGLCASGEVGGPPEGTPLGAPIAVAAGPSGALLVAEYQASRVVTLAAGFPGFGSQALIPSSDATELFSFDGRGRHLTTVDALTFALQYQFGYDEAGRLVAVTDGDGNVTAIERDASGNPTAIVAPLGQRTSLTVDADGWLASVVNPAGEATTLGYHPGGLLATLTDPLAAVHRFTYDQVGALIRDENPSGAVTTLTRSDFLTYSREGINSTEVDLTTALGRMERHVVDRFGPTRHYLNLARDGTSIEQWVYPTSQRRVGYPDGTTLESWDAPDPRFGSRSSYRASVMERTPDGNALAIYRKRSTTLATPGDPLSFTSMTEQTWVNGQLTSRTYDATAATLTDVTAAGRTTETLLDGRGRISEVRAPGVLPARLYYDGAGRLATVVQGARTWSLAYDGDGNAATLLGPDLAVTSYTFDPAGRLLDQVLAGDRSVEHRYDAAGRLVAVVPPARPAHVLSLGPSGELLAYTPPSVAGAGATRFAYDLDGSLVQLLLPDGTTVDIGRDAAGRRSSVATPAGTTTILYEDAGRVDTVTAPGGVVTEYDYDGPMAIWEGWSGPVSGWVDWSYTNDRSVASVDVNDVPLAAYTYDPDGLPVQAGALTIARDAATGWVTGTTLGAVTTSVALDGYGQVASASALAGGGTLYAYDLERDLTGRIVARTETVQGASHRYEYGYDAAGRLATVTVDGALAAAYAYDANGNRILRSTAAGDEPAAYDDQDRLLSSGGTTYSNDALGRLVGKTGAGGTTLYRHALGNLLGASLPGGRQIDYLLDGLERRVGKKVDGVLTEGYLYSGPFVVAWLEGTGAVRARFVRVGTEATPAYMEKGGVLYRLVADHLGSVRLVVDATTGAVAQRLDYDEFGRVLADTSPGFQPFGFAGGLLDRDTGLTRFGARDYDAEAGRWISKDPLLFQGGSTNLYEYVGNDPLDLVDPVGLYARCSVKGNKVAITIPIQFKGKGASKELTKAWRDAIQKEWSGPIGKYDVTTRVTRGGQNQVFVPRGGSVQAQVTGGHIGVWGNGLTGPLGGQTVAHEAGHLMGLGDKYWTMGDPWSGNGESINWEGWEDNIMADNPVGIPFEEDIRDIIRANCGCRR
ncbi:MAG TPA: fibronectin type III domain-containing protein [Anaeromyxobacter sp.]|nr:fibronectin type III domain-containing protein [Anaeromyxobacter sp.]